MEGTSGTYTMEVTKWNLRYGRYFMVLTPCKLPLGTYTMEVPSWNIRYGSYLMDPNPWKLASAA